MNGVPTWLVSPHRIGGLCDDCHRVPAETFWQSIAGPQLCGHCAALRLDILSTASPEAR